MSTTSTAFTGSSQFSADLQAVVSRAVQIATLPLTQLQTGLSTLQSKQSAYSTLQTELASVQSAIDAVGSATASYLATSSSTTVATVSASTGAQEGTYDLNVTTAGAYTVALSGDSTASGSTVTKVTDPSTTNIHSGTSFQLTVGTGDPITLTLDSSSLSSLVTAINNSSVGVQASIINLGTTSSPDYRLSLRSTAWKDEAIQLTAGSDALVSVESEGSPAVYTVNGLPSGGISTTDATVTLAPGLTATLAGVTGDTSISVSENRTGLSTALAKLASAYNAVTKDLSQYHGKDAGVLEGDSQISTIASELRQMINFGSGTDTSLTSFGLTFNSSGQLEFDSSTLVGASDSQIAAYFDSTSKTGFLSNANSLVGELTDNLLPDTQSVLTSAVARQNDQINDTQDRIDQLETSLNTKMAAADAAISALEQQDNYLTQMFAAMKQDSQDINS